MVPLFLFSPFVQLLVLCFVNILLLLAVVLGDATMLDALIPASQTFHDTIFGHEESLVKQFQDKDHARSLLRDALAKATEAAQRGADSTAELIRRKGPFSWQPHHHHHHIRIRISLTLDSSNLALLLSHTLCGINNC